MPILPHRAATGVPMGFSEPVVKEMQAELDRLRAEKRDIEQQIDLLATLLKNIGSTNRVPTQVTTSALPSTPADRSLADKGLREAIGIVINEKPGLEPMEVADTLKARGFPETSKTPMPTRVRNEMWRMKKDILLRQRGRRYYPVKEDAQSKKGRLTMVPVSTAQPK